MAELFKTLQITGQIRTFSSAIPTAAAAAAALGCEVGAIANSLIFATDNQPLLVIASGAHRVDLAKAAAQAGAKTVRRAGPEFVLEVTGQKVGAVAPIGHPHPITTLVDESLSKYEVVWAGAGTLHSMFPTTVDELVRITNGKLVAVS